MKYKSMQTALTAFKRKHKEPDYNDWFAFFQKLPANMVEDNSDDLKSKLPSDGFAALMRWIEIFKNPSKMEKIAKAKMEDERGSGIIDLATGDDDEAFYVGMIREAAEQLSGSGTSPQEVARLTANINIFRKELREIRSHRPKSGSVLEKVMNAANKPKMVKPKITERSPKIVPKKSKSVKPRADRGPKTKSAVSRSGVKK